MQGCSELNQLLWAPPGELETQHMVSIFVLIVNSTLICDLGPTVFEGKNGSLCSSPFCMPFLSQSACAWFMKGHKYLSCTDECLYLYTYTHVHWQSRSLYVILYALKPYAREGKLRTTYVHKHYVTAGELRRHTLLSDSTDHWHATVNVRCNAMPYYLLAFCSNQALQAAFVKMN